MDRRYPQALPFQPPPIHQPRHSSHCRNPLASSFRRTPESTRIEKTFWLASCALCDSPHKFFARHRKANASQALPYNDRVRPPSTGILMPVI